jgi:hypothetical protein
VPKASRKKNRRGTYLTKEEFRRNEREASRLRTLEIDRFDDLAADGLLGEILTDIAPALESCGYTREDLMRGLQESLWPEVFLEGTKSMSGILPRGGGRRGGYDMLARRIRYLKADKQRRREAEESCVRG